MRLASSKRGALPASSKRGALPASSKRGALLVALTLALLPASAHGEDIDDLLLGRDAYVNGEYSRAIERLRPVAELDVTSPRMAAVVTTARKFLAASMFARQMLTEAREMLSRMLRDDPDARLDQGQFEPLFVRLFDSVLREMQPEIERIRTQRFVSREQAEAQRAARELLMRQLISTESIAQEVPRELMRVPFGVGQFSNGQRGLGVFFLVAEATLTAACLTTFVVHQSIYPASGRYSLDEFATAETAQGMLIANWVSAGLLLGVTITGVIQANVVWQPVRDRRTVPRPVPAPLEGARLVALPTFSQTGAGLSLRLTF